MTHLPPDAGMSAPGDPLDAVWVDRDLGWLEFNRRVLAEAVDDRTPLLEQAKFLAIFSSNLDEFFMKRIALAPATATTVGALSQYARTGAIGAWHPPAAMNRRTDASKTG